MRDYICFFNGKQHCLKATSAYDAQKQGAKHFKVPPGRSYLVHVMLADVPVNTASL